MMRSIHIGPFVLWIQMMDLRGLHAGMCRIAGIDVMVWPDDKDDGAFVRVDFEIGGLQLTIGAGLT